MCRWACINSISMHRTIRASKANPNRIPATAKHKPVINYHIRLVRVAVMQVCVMVIIECISPAARGRFPCPLSANFRAELPSDQIWERLSLRVTVDQSKIGWAPETSSRWYHQRGISARSLLACERRDKEFDGSSCVRLTCCYHVAKQMSTTRLASFYFSLQNCFFYIANIATYLCFTCIGWNSNHGC